ncbi:MAG: hypothetical protein AB1405_14565 [Bdellovibrionota bacterium]
MALINAILKTNMRFFVTHPPDTRALLIVETLPGIDSVKKSRFKELLYGRGCSHGLLIDEQQAVLFEETFDRPGPESIVEVRKFKTRDLLARVDPSSFPVLEQRVAQWLNSLAAYWPDALSDETAPGLLSDIVPVLAGADVRAVYPAPVL